MINDPIVNEVRKARREIFESYDEDINLYLTAIMKKQKEYGKRLVALEPKKKKLEQTI